MQPNIENSTTIAAIATPTGRGGIGILRVSGPSVLYVAEKLLGKIPKPRYAIHGSFLNENGSILDIGLALYFPNPHSFTGEDVLELHCHGSAIVLDNVLQRVLSLGARLAKPGEFSERAFLNGKIDLIQAEAIADLIDSASSQAARSALRSLQGDFSVHINNLVGKLVELRTQIEAWIDFPEEEIDAQSQKQYSNAVISLLLVLEEIKKSAQQGVLLQEGLRVVIVGKPNAGKSSLLNRLSGEDTAIVTEIPGTTRDVLNVYLQIDGLPVNVIDTAGLQDTCDIVEQEGIRRARKEMNKADHILCLVDVYENAGLNPKEILKGLDVSLDDSSGATIVFNKIDLNGTEAKINSENGISCIYLSAKNGNGIQILREHLKKVVGFKTVGEGEGMFSARRRHLEALKQAELCLMSAKQYLELNQSLEIIAEELRQTQRILGEITGEFTTDDLLNRIFSTFCIGK